MPAEVAGRPTRHDDCPKQMVYGPCGGVGFAGECEIDATLRCAFVDEAAVGWAGLAEGAGREPTQTAECLPEPVPPPQAQAMRDLMATRPVVLVDFGASALSERSIRDCGAVLRDHCDAVLAGDHGGSRVQFPPAYRARLIREAGLNAWLGFNNRDRNRVALEAELAALAHAGATGVHCVTGDHTFTGSRPDAMPVFDLDSTQTAALARSYGHLVSVGESPCAPPVDQRPARLLAKQQAGAELCLVNHAGGVQPVAAFIAASRSVGVTLGFVPCVPVILDERSAGLLRSFTTLVLPPGYVESILAAPDPRAAGIAAAVELSLRLLDLHGVVGVDLSGGPAPGDELAYAESVAEIGARIAR